VFRRRGGQRAACNGWGTVFVINNSGGGCPANYFPYINVHWSTSGWKSQVGFTWNTSGNGNQVYLNGPPAGLLSEANWYP
jgi:hypothetical protein